MAMEMRGSLNLSKFRTTPNQPTYYGKCLINGVEYIVKGWEKENNGQPWISLLFEDPKVSEEKRKDEFNKRPESTRAKEVDFSGMDGEIPF
jgi:hypothetical protein